MERSAAPVFLTGATGFIGGRLAAALSARGRRLRCLVRSPERAGPLAALGAELVVGDVADEAVLRRALEGADLAYHLAGAYEVGRVDERRLERTNVDGTRAFLGAARGAGVERVVYVSSVVALGPVESGEGDERSSYDGPYPSVYHRTKTAAHRIALEAQATGLPLVIACPAYVYGPGDEGPAAEHLENVLRRRLPGLSTRPTIFSYVHVDDVVAGLVAAGGRGTPGATYVLGGEAASVNEFTELAGRLAGTWVSPLRFPPPIVKATGVLMDAIARVTGWRMPISAELADVGGRGERWVHSSERARTELGYSPRPLAEGLPETVRDMQERLGH
jgi:NAD+-dependent farnesol dehydrogenase